MQPSEERGRWHLVRIGPGCLKTTIIPARRNCQLIFQHGTGTVSKGLCSCGHHQSASPTQPALVQVTPSSSSSPWLRCWCSCASPSWMAPSVLGTAHLEVWREMTEDGRAHTDFTFPSMVPPVINRCYVLLHPAEITDFLCSKRNGCCCCCSKLLSLSSLFR